MLRTACRSTFALITLSTYCSGSEYGIGRRARNRRRWDENGHGFSPAHPTRVGRRDCAGHEQIKTGSRETRDRPISGKDIGSRMGQCAGRDTKQVDGSGRRGQCLRALRRAVTHEDMVETRRLGGDLNEWVSQSMVQACFRCAAIKAEQGYTGRFISLLNITLRTST